MWLSFYTDYLCFIICALYVTGETCYEEGIAYPGDNVKRITNTAEECATACAAEARCKHWTFKKSSYHCLLRSDITLTKNKKLLQKNEDAVSEFKGQIIQGSAINGIDVPLLPLLNSPEECQAACAADVRCQLWT